MLIVTHDVREAVLLGSTIALMRGGPHRAAGSFVGLVQRPVEPFVTEFFTAQAPPPELRASF